MRFFLKCPLALLRGDKWTATLEIRRHSYSGRLYSWLMNYVCFFFINVCAIWAGVNCATWFAILTLRSNSLCTYRRIVCTGRLGFLWHRLDFVFSSMMFSAFFPWSNPLELRLGTGWQNEKNVCFLSAIDFSLTRCTAAFLLHFVCAQSILMVYPRESWPSQLYVESHLFYFCCWSIHNELIKSNQNSFSQIHRERLAERVTEYCAVLVQVYGIYACATQLSERESVTINQ